MSAVLVTTMDRRPFDDLDERCQRGRVFYETFPGTAASDVWRAAFNAAHPRTDESTDRHGVGRRQHESHDGHGKGGQ